MERHESFVLELHARQPNLGAPCTLALHSECGSRVQITKSADLVLLPGDAIPHEPCGIKGLPLCVQLHDRTLCVVHGDGTWRLAIPFLGSIVAHSIQASVPTKQLGGATKRGERGCSARTRRTHDRQKS